MSAEARREQVLEAAARAFSRGGYAGTTTDDIAREAGVSQPYVVRMFGGKQELFRQVFDAALQRILGAFGAELARLPRDADEDDVWAQLGLAYTRLVSDRTVVLVLMHGFSAGDNPEIGKQAREGMSAIYTLLRTGTGGAPERVRDFVAHGMLLNVLLSMQAPEHGAEDPALQELAVCSFGVGLAQLVGGES
ncbi:MAG: putative TetR family transcriptional regulator [Frankiales bacterium]|nr:putative TetR family transcriptional regulator [Frankiales bacterium]